MATRAALSCQQNREQLDMMLLEEGGQMYELGYLVAAGALVPGRNLLGCTVGGADYYAGPPLSHSIRASLANLIKF